MQPKSLIIVEYMFFTEIVNCDEKANHDRRWAFLSDLTVIPQAIYPVGLYFLSINFADAWQITETLSHSMFYTKLLHTQLRLGFQETKESSKASKSLQKWFISAFE